MAVTQREVVRAYRQPGHPIAYSAPAAVARYFGIGKNRARRFLEHAHAYTLHREYKQPRVYNPYYVHKRREQVQADLMDVGKLSAHNDGVRFLLLLIDIFTKRVWLIPLRRKNARAMTKALGRWLATLDDKPDKIVTDRGLEFTNGSVQGLFRRNGVEWQAAFGTMKACIAERANKSIRILMGKMLTDRETLRYVDDLPDLVETYNKRGHRTLENMSPEVADRPESEPRVQAIFHQRYAEIGRQRRAPRFRVGELVRLKTQAKKVSSSAHSYAEQFHGEYFRIVHINRTLPIPLYYLRSINSGEMIEGGLYANELQRQRGDVFLVERIIRERVRRGRQEVFVKWMWFDDRWNEWIPRANLVHVY